MITYLLLNFLTITDTTQALRWRRSKPCIVEDIGHWWNGSKLEKHHLSNPDLVFDSMEKVRVIRKKLKATQSRQKWYWNVRKRDLEFDVDDSFYLKALPMKGVMHFRKRGTLSSIYVGSYRILKWVGKIAYKLDLPLELVMVHPLFHASILMKFVGEPYSISYGRI